MLFVFGVEMMFNWFVNYVPYPSLGFMTTFSYEQTKILAAKLIMGDKRFVQTNYYLVGCHLNKV